MGICWLFLCFRDLVVGLCGGYWGLQPASGKELAQNWCIRKAEHFSTVCFYGHRENRGQTMQSHAKHN